MAVTYTAEVSVDGIVATPNPDPTITWPPAIFDYPAFYTRVGLIVADYRGNRWVASYGVFPTDSSAGPVVFQSFSQLNARGNTIFVPDGPDPFTWATIENNVFTPGSASYTGGGTIAVIKDLGAGTITVSTPAGSASQLLTTNDSIRTNSAANTTPLIPVGIAIQSVVPQDGGIHDPESTDTVAQFFNFEAKRNTIVTYAQPLSAANPGTWFLTADESFDRFGGGSSDPATFFIETQLTTRYRMEVQTSVVTYPPWAIANFWRLFATVPPEEYGTDVDTAPEHGLMWRGGPDINDGTVMLVQRTFDNARAWETWTAFNDPATQNRSPTVCWYNQQLNLTWYDGSAIRNSRSLDGGKNWAMPTTIPFVGTNPRRVVDKQGGGSFFFYFDIDDLKVVVTYDNGGSWFGPFLVMASAGAQQIDADFVPDGSLVVSFFLAGIWTQLRSRDFARSWS